LYQGIFNYPERRLDEVCKSIDFLDDDYVLCIMGPEDNNKDRLSLLYSSERVFFLPYLPPPHYLEITKLATIGVMVYFSIPGSLDQCINTLYCAPNKLYEYSAFGIPMISNNVPALSDALKSHNAGICIEPFDPESIANGIKEIMTNYSTYSCGSSNLYDSIDIRKTINSIL
jgi:glycosyltransferase involved in cell wall biosynthesis